MEKSKFNFNIIETIAILVLIFTTTIFSGQIKPADDLFQKGLDAEQKERDFDKAIDIFQQVVSLSDRNAASAAYRIGECYRKKGDEEKAIQQFKEVISKYPKSKSVVFQAQIQINSLRKPGPEDYILELVSADHKTIYSLDDQKPSGLKNLGWKTSQNKNINFDNVMASMYFSADDKKDAQEFINLCRNLKGITLLKVTEPNESAGAFEKLPTDIIINAGLVPYMKANITSDTKLELDKARKPVALQNYDITWNINSSTISKSNPDSSVRILSLPDVQSWEKAINNARNILPDLKNSKDNIEKISLQNHPNYIAVLTSENNLAVVQVVRRSSASQIDSSMTTDPNTISICWWLEKIPDAETISNSK